ncbi:MAG TPA: methylated-DNA--[protein]-cysteine S-methyltransferase [Candidatus Polarisedimenticolia bacterium]|nr:methylated-DNA--[protein]-cysteine S-methyltransferase [Candidatus Polarisedimenticolia bacterium]
MTSQTQGTLFEIEEALRDRLRPEPVAADAVRRIARGALRRLAQLERIRDGFVVEASERGVVAVRRGRRTESSGAAARRHAAQGQEELHEYLDGRRSYFEVPVDLSPLAAFQRRVLEGAMQVPFGETTSYSALAARIGSPGASRAVGTALGRNPVPFIVPCHRILRGDRSLGGYAFGLPMKSDLLQLERSTAVLEGCTSTHILCRVGCHALARSRPDRRVVFASVADARSVGYRPCRLCRPEAA